MRGASQSATRTAATRITNPITADIGSTSWVSYPGGMTEIAGTVRAEVIGRGTSRVQSGSPQGDMWEPR